MIKKCKKHGRVYHFKRKDNSYRCGKCASEWVIRSRIKKKEKLVSLFGGKCKVCGYNKYIGALDFHHLNPKTKSFALSVRGLCYSWEIVVKEAKKCIILCKNCHAEVENGIIKL
jgi:5-methylcytosine-specific restriction endonuclease McrA